MICAAMLFSSFGIRILPYSEACGHFAQAHARPLLRKRSIPATIGANPIRESTMAKGKFIAVGENIHCTRIYKVGGEFVKEVPGKGWAIVYKEAGRERHLPIPKAFLDSGDWAGGKVGNHGARAVQSAVEMVSVLGQIGAKSRAGRGGRK
jgi:hypothetical protein